VNAQERGIVRSIQLAVVAAVSLVLLPGTGLAQNIRIGPGGVEVSPAPERRPSARPIARDDVSERMLRLREECEGGDRRSCVRFGMILGQYRDRQEEWRREHPEIFSFER
jgi:hypothetical protein